MSDCEKEMRQRLRRRPFPLTATAPPAYGAIGGGPNVDESEARPVRTPSPPETAWTRCSRLVRALSLSRFQAFVGTLAGILSIVGAVFSLVELIRPTNTGELVTIVQAAGSHRSVTDATIEVLSTQDAVVATLTPDASGRATQTLREG